MGALLTTRSPPSTVTSGVNLHMAFWWGHRYLVHSLCRMSLPQTSNTKHKTNSFGFHSFLGFGIVGKTHVLDQ